MAFGPDGHLYAAVGDGGGGGDPLQSGQNRETLLGKVLRLAVDVPRQGPAPYYSVPPDNPFVDTPGMLPEIWAWGLRNPWRISFDRLTGDLFIADVGQGNREEVNLQPTGSAGGENYGWPRMEGKACYSPGSGCQTGSLVLPILDYGHNEGCSVTGGYRYRGSRVPSLHGAYVFGDFCSKKIWIGIQGPGGTWSKQELLATGLSITTFGEDADGEIYVAHIGGTVHRLAPVRPRLTVTRSGGGAGTVNGPDGLNCGTACSAPYEPGQTVTLTVSLPDDLLVRRVERRMRRHRRLRRPDERRPVRDGDHQPPPHLPVQRPRLLGRAKAAGARRSPCSASEPRPGRPRSTTRSRRAPQRRPPPRGPTSAGRVPQAS